MKRNRRRLRNHGFERCGSRHYTVWIAREGRKPIVLAFRPIAIGLAIIVPMVAIVGTAFSMMQQNSRLNQRNRELAEEAEAILEQLESLESTLTTLQERAGLSEAEFEFEPDFDGEMTDREAWNDEDITDATSTPVHNQRTSNPQERRNLERQDNDPESEEFDFRGDDGVEWFGRAQPQTSKGGVGIVAAEDLLAIARSKLPKLLQDLKGEVEPALAEVILREEAKPKGVPLTAADTEITSPFGLRPNPFGWGYEFHEGIDFVAAYGTPIHVTAAGRVEKAEWEPGYGNYVVVNHGYGYQTLYAHLSELKVKTGQQLNRYQVVGYLGSTGRSSGPHLHYTVFHREQAVDPKKYLD
jgi:murein DD-endopeptidase MepM/ murein hydrolase activator NlpD